MKIVSNITKTKTKKTKNLKAAKTNLYSSCVVLNNGSYNNKNENNNHETNTVSPCLFYPSFSYPSYLSTSVQRGQGMLNRVAPGPFAVSARVQKTCFPFYNEYAPVFLKYCEENYINKNDDSTDLSSQSSSEIKSPTTTTSINHENNKEVLSSTEQGTKITKTVVFFFFFSKRQVFNSSF